jgi:hypothetical protein
VDRTLRQVLQKSLNLIESRLRRAAFRVAAAVASHTHDPDSHPDTQLLWSKGVARLCDVAGAADYWEQETESVQPAEVIAGSFAGAAGVVWVRLGTRSRDGEAVDLDAFAERVLPTIRRPFVLLTTDGDATVPTELRPETVAKLLASPWLMAWYTQNCEVFDHPVIKPFPIGLSLHNRRLWGSPRKSADELRALTMSARPAVERPLQIYSDIGVSLASEDRRTAAALLKGAAHVRSQTRRISQSETWRRYAASRFVLSLKGNGIDAHRTWEALYLGAIVITLRSTLDPLYDGLPVVLLDRIDELADPQNLIRWSEEMLPLTDRDAVWERLDARRWIDRLRQELA